MGNRTDRLVELDHAGKQARRTLRTSQSDAARDAARNTIRTVETQRADLLEGASDAEFSEYISRRNGR